MNSSAGHRGYLYFDDDDGLAASWVITIRQVEHNETELDYYIV